MFLGKLEFGKGRELSNSVMHRVTSFLLALRDPTPVPRCLLWLEFLCKMEGMLSIFRAMMLLTVQPKSDVITLGAILILAPNFMITLHCFGEMLRAPPLV